MNTNIDQRIEDHNATLQAPHFYTDEQIAYLRDAATNQEKRIGRVYFKNPNKLIGPTYVHQMLFPTFPNDRGDWAITSTRRAINSLTKAGILRKTNTTEPSLLDGVESQWRWRKPGETNCEDEPEEHPTHAELLQKHAGKQMNFYNKIFGETND